MKTTFVYCSAEKAPTELKKSPGKIGGLGDFNYDAKLRYIYIYVSIILCKVILLYITHIITDIKMRIQHAY